MLITLIVLGFLGLCFGSFINALVWRVHEAKPIVRARSQCPHCGHELAADDLVPVFSWLALRGRCRYCGLPISRQYPSVELATAAVFVGSFVFWPGGVYGAGDWTAFITWLLTAVGLMALLIYDFKWLLLPNHILYPTLAIAAAGRLIYIVSFEPHKARAAGLWLLSVVVASGLFWLIFMASSGKLIGYGDVRLGLITGTVLATPAKSLLMIVIASMLGTLFVLPGLLTRQKGLTTKVPYGPFLITATWAVVLFGQHVLDWYKQLMA